MKLCEYCGVEMGDRKEEARFCCDKHRAAWSREHDPHGIVQAVYRIANGGIAVIIHSTDEGALRLHPGDSAVFGAVGVASNVP